MKPAIIPILGLIFTHGAAVAQDDIPMLLPEERQAVDAQTDEFNHSLMPALTLASKSTVRIWAGNRRLAYGTVIGDGRRILTKWSEVARGVANLRIEASGGAVLAASLVGVYKDEDLAVLETKGPSLTPVQWGKQDPPLGAFLVASQLDGKPAAFGVVSVLERNLRDTDQAFLGVSGSMDFRGPGVQIQEVTLDTGAAAAGLKPGHVILKVGERPISGLLELKNALSGRPPGSKVALLVRTDAGEKTIEVLLGNRPPLQHFSGERLHQMERMGGPISRVRDSFTRVIQSDMRLQPDQVGGPVVDLKGRVVGITMARADRTRSLIMPAAALERLLLQEPQAPALVQHQRNDAPASPQARGRNRPKHPQAGGDELMRRHLFEMQRLMDRMREEMETLDR